jgi:hypothetical protein
VAADACRLAGQKLSLQVLVLAIELVHLARERRNMSIGLRVTGEDNTRHVFHDTITRNERCGCNKGTNRRIGCGKHRTWSCSLAISLFSLLVSAVRSSISCFLRFRHRAAASRFFSFLSSRLSICPLRALLQMVTTRALSASDGET